jgi:lipopolysaccharide transport system ATP-binding protein
MKPTAIEVRNVGKRFRKYHKDRPYTFQEAIVKGLQRLNPAEQFWALRHINFSVPAGTTFGIIGKNGAGKSTLLTLIGGVSRPDEGTLQVNGRVGGLLELGAGFHPDLTGRENVYVNGIIFSLTRRQVDQRFDSIVSFAELESVIDDPLRTYSSGMRMRLGFSIAAHTNPEILLIDEVLAVGDISFQQKCFERIREFKRGGCTVLLVTHDNNQVRKFCDEVIWLQGGELVAQGEAETVVGQYESSMRV